MTAQPLSQGVPLKCHQRHTAVGLPQPVRTSTFATEPHLSCVPSVPYPVRYLPQCRERDDQGARMADCHSGGTHPIRQGSDHRQSGRKADVRSGLSVTHTHAYEYSLSTASIRRTYQRTSRTRHESGRYLQSDFGSSYGNRSGQHGQYEAGNRTRRFGRQRLVCYSCDALKDPFQCHGPGCLRSAGPFCCCLIIPHITFSWLCNALPGHNEGIKIPRPSNASSRQPTRYPAPPCD